MPIFELFACIAYENIEVKLKCRQGDVISKFANMCIIINNSSNN